MRYNFLILHSLFDLKKTRKSLLDHLMFCQRYAPGDHNYCYHNVREPVTDVLRNLDFHVIVLSTTALSFCRNCKPRETYDRFKNAWSFIGERDAIKLAFPQDDYLRTNDVDALFDTLRVNVIYSVLPEFEELFYPRSRRSAEVRAAMTGYVDDDSLRTMSKYRRTFDQRTFDIVQRVKMYPAWGGYFSQIKGEMAERFAETCKTDRSLNVNISTRAKDVLTGDDWMKLLGNGRFALGSEGGVSLWDPDGIYSDLTIDYLERNPHASFDEVEAACFPGEDGKYVFSALTPRLFEAATMECSPILIEGEYGGLLQPWEHYIPVKQDLSDVQDAVEATKDVDAAKRRIAACREALIENPSLRYGSLAREVMEDVDRLASGRGFREMQPADFRRAIGRHRAAQRGLLPFAPTRFLSHIARPLLNAVPPGVRRVVPRPAKEAVRKMLIHR